MTANIQISLREAADYIDRLETELGRANAGIKHPRYVVEQVNGYGPNRRPSTWYKIVDRATPMPYPYGFKRVGVAYDATDARHIAEMFEARST